MARHGENRGQYGQGGYDHPRGRGGSRGERDRDWFDRAGDEYTLLGALAKRKDVTNLTGVSNNAGFGDSGLGAS